MINKLAVLIALTCVSGLVLAQDTPAKQPAGKSKSASSQAAKPAAKPHPSQAGKSPLPANAEKVEEGLWRAKDSAGKTWYYRATPFGYSRYEEPKEAAPEAPSAKRTLRIVGVEGEKVTFEGATPFGKPRWTRSLSEMDADEKAAYELYQNEKSQKAEQK